MRTYSEKQIKQLTKLMAYSNSNRYEINIQFWPDQTAVYISKDGVDLQSYGGSFEYSISSSLSYINRINKPHNP